MNENKKVKIGYVVKRYPRLSETFVVNEVLAHEAAGYELNIFALRATIDTHFQDLLSFVKSPVHFLDGGDSIKGIDFWSALDKASHVFPDIWPKLSIAQREDHRNVYQAVQLALEIKMKGITHVHAHFASSATSVARMAAHFAGITYSFTAHAKDIFHESVDANDLRRKLNDAAAVITISDYHVRHFQTHYPDASGVVQRVYNGLNLDRFQYQKPQRGQKLIMGVGRLIEKKGFDVLIEAGVLLKERGIPFQCQIIGQGPAEEQLRAKIRQRQLEEYIQLLGPKPQKDIIADLRQAAIMAAPCVVGEDGNQDGLPTVLIESMALGVPCVSTDVTGIPEAIINGQTGFLVAQHNAQELGEALERLLEDYDLRVSISQNARALIEERFDIQKNAREIQHIFEAIHEKSPRVLKEVG